MPLPPHAAESGPPADVKPVMTEAECEHQGDAGRVGETLLARSDDAGQLAARHVKEHAAKVGSRISGLRLNNSATLAEPL